MSETANYTRKCYDLVMERILGGNLRPGDEINRREIAMQVGASIAPVNEALGQLRTEGFVEVAPRRGTRVRPISREDLAGLLIVRQALECEAARLYHGDPVRQARDKLLGLAVELDRSRPGSIENERGEVRFHRALVALTGRPILMEEHEKIMRRRLFFRISIVMASEFELGIGPHSQLVDELETKDPDKAEAAMRRHLERGRTGVSRSL